MIALLLHLSALLTAVCVAGMWEGLVIALLALALISFTPRASAGFRHTMLLALFAGAVVLPWIHFQQPLSAEGDRGLQLVPWVAGGISLLWITAIIFRGVQLYQAWRYLCAVRRDAVPVSVAGPAEFRAGIRQAVLCTSPDVDSPSILGFGSPRLLLPDWMLPILTAAELQQIVLHECEHLRRGDDWINLLLQVGIVLSPLNPALLWLNRRICVQRELAVDAAVVSRTAQPLSYAACLTRLAEQRREHGRLRLALAAWERKSELVQRVHALLDRHAVWTRRQSAWAAGASVAALLMVSFGLARVPQFVHVGRSPVMVAAGQPLATVVPMVSTAAMSQERVADIASTPHMVPASFHVKSRPAIRPRTRRSRKAVTAQTGTSLGMKAVFVNGPQSNAHMVRTRAASSVASDSDQVNAVPARLVITDFYVPYVAVPISNGWLVIEL